MSEFHEQTSRPAQGGVVTPLGAVRKATPTDLSVTPTQPFGLDGVWVALQVDADGYLRVRDDFGSSQGKDLLTAAQTTKAQQAQISALNTELLKQALFHLSILSGQPVDEGAIAALEG